MDSLIYKWLPSENASSYKTKKMGNKIKKIISSLSNYLKAEAILILISFVIVLIRIIFLKSNRHANRVSASCSIGHRIC